MADPLFQVPPFAVLLVGPERPYQGPNGPSIQVGDPAVARAAGASRAYGDGEVGPDLHYAGHGADSAHDGVFHCGLRK
ncbi:hypothetical protein Sspor_78190 [Streptomyces spororaveus]|uniref:Uncharacterized protein n=1 Tax=Streptomyces spororaveus TaxID=284039 RepID=A0ABQ3TPG0_9ACTN|nr:hypothetical protein Sspor_78190 [Streptomyces spororaveus]